MDTPPEESFDNLTKLAAKSFDVDVALLSLVDEDRLWLKARHGLEVDEVPREESLCNAVVREGRTVEIPDTLDDSEAQRNSLVTERGIRMYYGVPVRSPDGSVIGTFCLLNDSPRQLSSGEVERLETMAEQAQILVRNYSRLQDARLLEELTNNSTGALFVVDPDTGQFVYGNDSALDSLQYSRDELLSRHVQDVDSQIGEDLQWETFVQMVKQEGTVEFESMHVREDGSKFPVELTVDQVSVDGKQYLVAESRDTTEKQQRLQERREREEQFRRMAENINEIFWMFTPDWEEVIFINETQYEDIFGLPAEEIYEDATAFLEGVHPEDRHRVEEAMAEVSEGREIELEYRVDPNRSVLSP
ncbi:MAG: GAF domain-containing protein [bacterium]